MPNYISTRATAKETNSFEDVVMQGLASDGGLFVPSEIPQLPEDFLESWSKLTFQELAFEIMRFYIDSKEINDESLKKLIFNSYKTFKTPEVTPVVKPFAKNSDASINQVSIMELFHGPTYAFKDVALQFVGNLFEFFLERRNAQGGDHKLTVVGATSGDTGSAAIYGLRNKKNVSVFILYPTGRISPIQEQQMTTVPDKNVHTLSVNGFFDDCQTVVKNIFADKEFNSKYHVGAVNSINWARILAQITYYFYSYFQISKGSKKEVAYVVPSGNFGDVLAGWFAKKMGLPISKLVIATNENDILDRFLKTGVYEKIGSEVTATHSPAMDILISSNFERLLFYLARETLGNDELKAGETLAQWMQNVKQSKPVKVSDAVLSIALKDFSSSKVSNDETIATIKQVYEISDNKYVADPHTAVGLHSAFEFSKNHPNTEVVTLSTAHPAKFADAVDRALSGFSGYTFDDVLPSDLAALSTKEKRIRLVEKADVKLVESIIEEELAKE